MHGFHRVALLAAPPRTVFAFLTDQRALPRWSPMIVESRVVGGGRLRAGALLRQVRRDAHGEREHRVTVVEHAPPRRHVLHTRTVGVDITFAFTLWPRGAGTRIEYACTCEGLGPSRLWEKRVADAIEDADGDRLERLRRALAGRS